MPCPKFLVQRRINGITLAAKRRRRQNMTRPSDSTLRVLTSSSSLWQNFVISGMHDRISTGFRRTSIHRVLQKQHTQCFTKRDEYTVSHEEHTQSVCHRTYQYTTTSTLRSDVCLCTWCHRNNILLVSVNHLGIPVYDVVKRNGVVCHCRPALLRCSRFTDASSVCPHITLCYFLLVFL